MTINDLISIIQYKQIYLIIFTSGSFKGFSMRSLLMSLPIGPWRVCTKQSLISRILSLFTASVAASNQKGKFATAGIWVSGKTTWLVDVGELIHCVGIVRVIQPLLKIVGNLGNQRETRPEMMRKQQPLETVGKSPRTIWQRRAGYTKSHQSH